MELARFLMVAVLLAFSKSGNASSANDGSQLTYPLDGMKEFKIEVADSGTCIDSNARISPCEDAAAKMTWKWRGNALENVDTNQCLTWKSSVLTVDSCEAKQKKNELKRDLAKCDTTLAWVKGKCLKATEDNSFTTVHCENEKPTSFYIYFGKALAPRIMICSLKESIGQRTDDPQYYYFKNDRFKITWTTKYVKMFFVFHKSVYDSYLKRFDAKRADEEIKAVIQDGVSMLDKAYRQINLRILLAGYEVWKDKNPIGDTVIYSEQKALVRDYSYYNLRKKHDYDTLIFFQAAGWWDGKTGKKKMLGGAGMSDLCKLNTKPSSEMFVMGAGCGSSSRILKLITHEFGHQVFQGHNFEPGKPCPFYRMFGSKCTMGGNRVEQCKCKAKTNTFLSISYKNGAVEPKGFSSNFFTALQNREESNLLACVSTKPNLQSIQSPRLCGNGIKDLGEACDCGSSEDCLKLNPCCDGMTCQLKAGAECSDEKCCSNCKIRTTGECSGDVKVLTAPTGSIISGNSSFNIHRHWRIVAKPGERIAIFFALKSLFLDFHIDCAYDYIKIRDGGTKDSKVIGTYCNSKMTPGLIKSSSNELFITFHADMTFSSQFTMTYFVMHPDSFRTGSFSLSAPITAKELTYDKCTGESRGIKCGEGNSIEIMEASFGKIDGADCGNKASDICDTVSVLSTLKKKCDGKMFCKYKVTTKEFGDRCPGVIQALRVKHRCVSSSKSAKLCLNYVQEAKKFKFKKQTTPCTERFEWLDTNAIRHIKSKMCLGEYGRLTHNCYAYSSAYVKVKNGRLARVSSNCVGQARDGSIKILSCEDAPEIHFN